VESTVVEQLGVARKITCASTSTTMIADAASKDEIDMRIAQLKKELAETDSGECSAATMRPSTMPSVAPAGQRCPKQAALHGFGLCQQASGAKASPLQRGMHCGTTSEGHALWHHFRGACTVAPLQRGMHCGPGRLAVNCSACAPPPPPPAPLQSTTLRS
jgi:hypothetical protein